MKAVLVVTYRRYGRHTMLKEMEVDLSEDCISGVIENIGENRSWDYRVNEEQILSKIPAGWLPVAAKNMLLWVGDSFGMTAVSNPDKFCPWGKYFDAHSLQILLPSKVLEKIDHAAVQKFAAC